MIYIDDYQVPATVKGIRSLWSHLFAWSPDISELIEFGERIGLKREWLQYPDDQKKAHFDVAQSKRELAIKNGAVQIKARDIPTLKKSFDVG